MASTFSSAFDGIAPSASTSAASSSKHYDVFMNCRGPDVKHTLASSIYHALNCKGLRVFLDSEELELGDFLPEALEEAMRTASLHISIFSKNYAQSVWCLNELAFMLQTGSKMIPVFYQVRPSDTRLATIGKGIYADAFSAHENKGRYTSEKLQLWKWALHQTSFYEGYVIDNEEDEPRVLKNIVNCVLKEIKKVPLEVAKHPVGLNEAVQDFEMTVLKSAGPSHENVQIVGIWGMGGCGKTTLAKELYNRKSLAMKRSSFLFDLRDAVGKGELHRKQKKLLEDLGVNAPSFDIVEEGKGILARCLRSLCVFMVLDDVGHPDQLDALLPPTDILGRGSLIIVTTRDLNVLRSYGISAVYKMRALDSDHAKQLFCWHAFLQSSPLCGFEDLVEKFLIFCQALPLSLKVVGGLLYGRPRKEYWDSTLKKILLANLPKDIRKILTESYDALDKEEKEMFLDLACFFIGEENSLAIAAWDGSGWNGLHGWQRLVDKCLVEVDEENKIKMHNHLRDLGREIANRWSPYRLWFPTQIIDIQPHQKIIQIRGMVNKIDSYVRFPRWSSEGKIEVDTSEGIYSLKPSRLELKFLVGNGDFLNLQVLDQLSRKLVWFRWSKFEQRNPPMWPSLKKLRILEFTESRGLQELWQVDADAPLGLRELVIFNCPDFQGFPRSIGNLKHLKKIRLCKLSAMTSLPEEFCYLQSLEHLELKYCARLASLPSSFGELANLRHLDLSHCKKLRILPVSFKKLTFLQYLNLEDCSELTIALDILGYMTQLEYLSLPDCLNFEEVPRHITKQGSLKEQYLNKNLLQAPLQLRELAIYDCPEFQGFPMSIGHLKHLKKLTINTSSAVTSVPDEFCLPQSLEHLEFSCSGLLLLPSSFGDVTNLRHLDLSHCFNLRRLPDSFNQLTQLEYLDLSDCRRLTISSDMWENITALKTLKFLKYTGLEESIHMMGKELNAFGSNQKFLQLIGQLRHLEKIVIDGCVNTSLKVLPEEFCRLKALKILTLRWCRALISLPAHFGNLKSLQHLDIVFCSQLKELPDSFKQLKQLQHLDFQGCNNLTIPPHFLGKITTLQSVNFKDCGKLRVLPTQVPCQLSLRSLILVGTRLEELPNEVGMLINLEVLEIGSPYLTGLPVSMGNMMNLRTLDVEGCTSLTCLPESLWLLQNLSSIKAPESLKETAEQLLEERLGIKAPQSLKETAKLLLRETLKRYTIL